MKVGILSSFEIFQSSYTLGGDGTILCIGGEWDQFAQSNDGQRAMMDNVIGTTIWNHVHGFETCSFLNAVFFAVRKTGLPISLPYRCDGPTERRDFSMTISPLDGMKVKIDHFRIMHVEAGVVSPVVSLTDRHTSDICAVCCSFKIGDTWGDPFARPHESEFPRGLGRCPECKRRAAAQTRKADDTKGNKVLDLWRG